MPELKTSDTEILDEGRALALSFTDGTKARFHALWLLDNAPEARDAKNGQKLTTLNDLPSDPRLTKATCAGDELRLSFQDQAEEVHVSRAWLQDQIYDRPAATENLSLPAAARRFDATLTPARARLEDLRAAPAALASWLAAVERDGLALVEGLALTSGSLLDVVALFGYVRETNYGKWFEVRAEIKPSNLAYTGLGLQCHTDNPYRDPVPTLQLISCLENSAEGGENQVVDGFRALEVLESEAPRHAALLARFPVRFSYRGMAGVRLEAKRPMIELSPDGEVVAIRFNNRAAAPWVDLPYEIMPDFYAAARHFAEIIERPALQVSFKLKPGEAFLIDNTRVLHGRSGFSGSGTRWLQGCYPDKDGLLSTLRALEAAA